MRGCLSRMVTQRPQLLVSSRFGASAGEICYVSDVVLYNEGMNNALASYRGIFRISAVITAMTDLASQTPHYL